MTVITTKVTFWNSE